MEMQKLWVWALFSAVVEPLYVQALSRAAEDSMQHFTEHASVALPRAVDDWVSAGSDSQTLNFDIMVLPGALEVYLIRAADLELVGVSLFLTDLTIISAVI